MAHENLSSEDALKQLDALTEGQKLLINYFDSKEEAYFVAKLDEPEHEGKIIVMLGEKYEQVIIDLNEGQLINITDEFPYSAHRFSLMKDFGAKLSTDTIPGERPDTVGEMYKILDNVYLTIENVKQYFAASQASDSEDPVYTDEDAAKILTQSQELISNRADFVESQEDMDIINSVESELSARFNVESLNIDSSADEDHSDADTLAIDDDVSLSVLDESALDPEGDLDTLSDDTLRPSETLDSTDPYMAHLDPNQIRPVLDPNSPEQMVNGQPSSQGHDGGSLGVGDAIAALVKGSASVLKFTGEAMAKAAGIGSEVGAQRFEDGLSSHREKKFDEKYEKASENLSSFQGWKELITTPEIQALVDRASNFDENDIHAERDRQEAVLELRSKLDSSVDENGDSDYRKALVSLAALTGSINELEEYRSASDPDNAAKAELVEQLIDKTDSSIEDFSGLAKGDEMSEGKIAAMREALAKLVQMIKSLFSKTDESSAVKSMQSSPGA